MVALCNRRVSPNVYLSDVDVLGCPIQVVCVYYFPRPVTYLAQLSRRHGTYVVKAALGIGFV